MAIPVGWSSWSDDEKYEYTIAFVRERMDAAKPECRKTPLVNKSGKITKPATIACGSVCRQPKNCDLSKSEQGRIAARLRGQSSEDLRRAILQAKRKKRQGASGTGAVYEATKGALGQQGRDRLERKKQKGEDRAKPQWNPDDPVVLGKPVHDRVATPEEAIANGRAILGGLIGRLAASHDEGEYGRRLSVLGYRLRSLELDLVKGKIDGASDEELNSILEQQRDLNLQIKALESPTIQGAKANGLSMDLDDLQEIQAKYKHEVGRIARAARWMRMDPERQQGIADMQRNLRNINKEIKAKLRLKAERELLFKGVMDSLLESSNISPSDAARLAKGIKVTNLGDGEDPEGVRKSLETLIRLSNGQAMGSLREVVFNPGRKGAHAEEGTGKINYNGDESALYHEFGHHVEFSTGAEARTIGMQWVKSRASDSLQYGRKMGGYKYANDFAYHPGNFINPYVGRDYGRGDISEVISVGLQSMSSPDALAEFAAKDPDHLALVLGVLRQDYDIPKSTETLLQVVRESLPEPDRHSKEAAHKYPWKYAPEYLDTKAHERLEYEQEGRVVPVRVSGRQMHGGQPFYRVYEPGQQGDVAQHRWVREDVLRPRKGEPLKFGRGKTTVETYSGEKQTVPTETYGPFQIFKELYSGRHAASIGGVQFGMDGLLHSFKDRKSAKAVIAAMNELLQDLPDVMADAAAGKPIDPDILKWLLSTSLNMAEEEVNPKDRQLIRVPAKPPGRSRSDSLLSEGYFGLNPNPFDKPLWRAMGIA